uniref:Si:ch211-284o19.8 n=1 Tax=Poecilia reticulata TaxID=8081 RepID=A0A3P9MY37_POERE
MADQREPLIPKPPPDASSPPPYSYHDQPPPAYSAAPVRYGPHQSEAVVTGYESFRDINPEIASDTNTFVSSSFEDETVRRGFARKVFSILTLQLLFTFSVVCVFTFSSVVKEAVQNNLWAYLSSFIVFIVVAFTLSCCRSFSRRHPWNLVGLVIVTLSLSYMVGTVASFHNTTAVVITMAVTFLGVLLFCFQTRYDFTIYYGVLLIMAVDVIMFGVICTFYYSHVASIIYGCLGALLYSLFLLVDCQLMMGKMSYRLNPEEYVNAALTIYLDIILIFLYLLGRR